LSSFSRVSEKRIDCLMRIFACKEHLIGERRAPVTPTSVAKLIRMGAKVEVEEGIGTSIFFRDADYETAGAQIGRDRERSLREADLVLRVRKPTSDEAGLLKAGCIQISFLDPFNERQLVERLAEARVSAISMEMLPRITVAQKMDALSSQANLSGYVAVILAARYCSRIFPMMITPAGTIKPLRVLVIGVGVAGLQAIATARRLGATVEAFDTRPAVEEQVKSLGARFVKIDLGEVAQTADGYAKPLTPEQIQKQRELLAERVASADVVITAAQVFGRKAPVIVTSAMVGQMNPGSVIVDTAVESGGNVEGVTPDKVSWVGGVTVVALTNLPSRVATNASEMLANNFAALIEHCWDKQSQTFAFDLSQEILRRAVVTHAGEICNETIRGAYGLPPLQELAPTQ
jgi:proton-translocating NAD(P)+ transhydrogenase subunit alpha